MVHCGLGYLEKGEYSVTQLVLWLYCEFLAALVWFEFHLKTVKTLYIAFTLFCA